jgi:Fe-S-cluster containining protein
MSLNPCTSCGACCAFFRASFYWAEIDEAGGTVPTELTQQVSPFMRAMKGTFGQRPRCVALQGEIGKEVGCSIYEKRSSVCRDFPVAWENGVPNERCDKARIAHGLEPLKPPLNKAA